MSDASKREEAKREKRGIGEVKLTSVVGVGEDC